MTPEDRAESDKFWRGLIYTDGKLDEERILSELADFSFIMEQVSKVYGHVTNGLLSKSNYYADDVIGEADDYTSKLAREAVQEEREACAKVAEDWEKHYPADVFIEPPPGEHGITVDACSARAARHTSTAIAKAIRERLDLPSGP